MGPSLRLTRIVALVGGLGLIAAFFMPWFASQGLLLSGEFLHTFLSTSSPADIQRFVPGTTPAEQQLLRLLVDLFPAAGVLAALLSLAGAAAPRPATSMLDALLALSGLVALAAWAAGVPRLPQGARWEIGLWLIAVSALAVLSGAALELAAARRPIAS
jgi:hypothetical protein